jgi:hypothetical protein
MTNEKNEQHLEKVSQTGEGQVAGKPILNGTENATQQRIEKQTAARAHRFTKGDNPFTIDMGNGSTVRDARPQSPQEHDKQLLAENTVDEQNQRKQEQNQSDRAPLSGEVSNDVTDLIAPGHTVKFTLRAGGGVNWQPAGHWDPEEWNAQLKALHDYFTAHPERLNALAAEVKQNGGPLTLGIEAAEPPPQPHPHPSGDGSHQKQWLVGSGLINGHPVQIGGPNDIKIPANAGPNTPVVLSTTDGSGETIHGRIRVDRNGQKFFYPDYTEDSQNRQYRVQNPQQNMIPLTNAGIATYEPYDRQ